MGNIDRATLPSEFYDITSAQMLIQPDHQYLHAALLKGALNAELDLSSGVDLGIPGRTFPEGGASYPDFKDQQALMLADPIYRDAVKVVVELGKGPGHQVRINRPQFTDSTYTQASRTIPVGSTISTTPINVGGEQVSITIGRLGGPYDNDASAVRPYGIERFDAARGVHSMREVRDMHFKRDFDKTLDTIGVALFDSASTAVYPTGMTAVNDAVQVGDRPFSFQQILATRTSLSTGKIPTFANGRYMMILTPLQLEQLQGDSDYQRLVRTFDSDLHPVLRKQYQGSVNKFDIFESTTLATTVNSSSIPIQYGQAFGPGMVGLGAGEMPRVMASTDDNYGEAIRAVWLFYCGFAVLDNRFGRSVRSS